MQMHQVRYFLALCEELNFTRAARRCGVSQPSLTTAISALERDLGGALFHRKPSIALTGLGRMVRPLILVAMCCERAARKLSVRERLAMASRLPYARSFVVVFSRIP